MSAMRTYKFTVPCRGCQNIITMEFIDEKKFTERRFPCFCKKCQSALCVEVRQGDMDKRIQVRCQMVKHSKKLERILKIRALGEKFSSIFRKSDAKDHAEQ